MEESRKDKIINNLQQAKQTGQLKTENIREIVKTAVSEAVLEVKEGRSEISSLVQDAIAAVVEILKDKQEEVQEGVSASIEGAIEGISDARREAITGTESEIKTLQGKVEETESQLQQEIDVVLEDIQTQNKDKSSQVNEAINAAIKNLENSEEVALLQKRYAQLKAQLAVIQANLAARYGSSYGNVNQYLDDAKTWYDRAKENPEVFTGRIEEKQQEFEEKLGKTGVAAAKKEQQLKQLLKELWKSISEVFRDRKNL